MTDEELLGELKRRFEENKKSLQELRELNEQLIIVNKKLTESEAMKTHFISHITNEIINPFTSIIGLAESILSLPDKDWTRMRRMTNLIYSEAFGLDFQLKNIFIAAEIEAGEVYPCVSNVDVKSVIENVIEIFQREAMQNQISIEMICKPCENSEKKRFFKTDAEKLRIIVANLLSNALKFSFQKGKIIVHIEKEDSILKIAVKDLGSGISKENQRIIFDRFERLNAGIDSIHRGQGLGLSVVKAILDMLEGRIEISDNKPQGAIFTIFLPESNISVTDFSENGDEIFFGETEIF